MPKQDHEIHPCTKVQGLLSPNAVNQAKKVGKPSKKKVGKSSKKKVGKSSKKKVGKSSKKKVGKPSKKKVGKSSKKKAGKPSITKKKIGQIRHSICSQKMIKSP